MSDDKEFLERLNWKPGDLRVFDPETGKWVQVDDKSEDPPKTDRVKNPTRPR